MPGGNPTIKIQSLDLGSFLQRKRKSLETWLIQNNITSEQALQNFLKNPEWSVSENLAETIRGFFVAAPVKPEQTKKEEVADKQVVKTQTLPPPPALKEEQLVEITSPEEMVSFVEVEEVAETRSALLNRERKKNR
jgi:hypothetical protein